MVSNPGGGGRLGSVVGCFALIAFADEHDGSRCWVIEGCGSRGRGLATSLLAHGEDVCEIANPRRPARRMGKKSDDLDALRVAREALGRDDLATPRTTGARDALAALLVARRSAVEATPNASSSPSPRPARKRSPLVCGARPPHRSSIPACAGVHPATRESPAPPTRYEHSLAGSATSAPKPRHTRPASTNS